MAAPICLGSLNMVLINASTDGITVAPATPSRARAMINIVVDVEKAATSETTMNAAAPNSSTLRRPTRSPSVPIVTRNPVIMKP